MKTGILFDLDGTLLNTLEDLRDATNYTLRHYGCPERTLEQIRCVLGNGAENQIRKSLPGTEHDPDLQEALSVYREYYNAHCQIKTAPYPGIMEVLGQLEKKYPLAVVSNKPDKTVKELAKIYFPSLYARGESADCPRKPAPDMIRKAMAELGVERCIYVGDSEVDVQTAKNANVPCLTVTWGFRNGDELVRCGATHFCHTPEDMPRCIEQILEEME